MLVKSSLTVKSNRYKSLDNQNAQNVSSSSCVLHQAGETDSLVSVTGDIGTEDPSNIQQKDQMCLLYDRCLVSIEDKFVNFNFV